MKRGWLYIMTNKPHGILYVGVTSSLVHRVHQHRQGFNDGFTRKYGLKRLVYAEEYEMIVDAIQREKRLKHWPRRWKVDLIKSVNPEWNDLAETLF